ncbi:hypothetical protein ACFLWM_00410 [Chloroflexota bacterium]
MDISKALSLLENLLDEIPRLKRLHHKNPEYNLWDETVEEILRGTFGNMSNEHTRYKGIILLKRVHTEEDKQQAYIDFLRKREAALKSIIKEHKTIREQNKYQKIWGGCKDFVATIIAKFLAEKAK